MISRNYTIFNNSNIIADQITFFLKANLNGCTLAFGEGQKHPYPVSFYKENPDIRISSRWVCVSRNWNWNCTILFS